MIATREKISRQETGTHFRQDLLSPKTQQIVKSLFWFVFFVIYLSSGREKSTFFACDKSIESFYRQLWEKNVCYAKKKAFLSCDGSILM